MLPLLGGILQSNTVCTALSPDFILHSYFDMKLAKSCLMIKCRDFVCVLRPRKSHITSGLSQGLAGVIFIMKPISFVEL